jgi:hypothetical protein
MTRFLQTFGFEVTTESLILGRGSGEGRRGAVLAVAAAFGVSWKTWQILISLMRWWKALRKH